MKKALYKGQEYEIQGMPGRKNTRLKTKEGSILVVNESLTFLEESSVDSSIEKASPVLPTERASPVEVSVESPPAEVLSSVVQTSEQVSYTSATKETQVEVKNWESSLEHSGIGQGERSFDLRSVPRNRAHLHVTQENKAPKSLKGPFPNHAKKQSIE